MGLMIWCNTRANKYQVSDSEAAMVYKKIKDNRRTERFSKMDVQLSNGETVQLSKTFVGYDCEICHKEHIIYQKCDMEVMGACEECGKAVQRFVFKRKGMYCMLHKARV